MRIIKFVAVIALALIINGCSREDSPTTDDVKQLIVNTQAVHERIAGLGNIEIKIKNQYTRKENGVSVFYYDFKLIMADHTNLGGVGSGTIAIEKAGNYWKSRIDGWSNY